MPCVFHPERNGPGEGSAANHAGHLIATLYKPVIIISWQAVNLDKTVTARVTLTQTSVPQHFSP